MRVPGAWRINAGGVPVPPPPTGAARRAKIALIRASLPRAARKGPRYVPESPPWEPYFRRRHAEQLEATNGVVPSGRLNSERQRRWWGVPGRTLEAVLEYIEGGNTPRLEYPEPPSFSRRRGSSWTPRRMDPRASSSSSGRSTGSPCLRPIKPEPQDMHVSRRTRSSGIRIADSTPASGRLVLVAPKPEPSLPPEYEELVRRGFSDEDALRWARDDYLRDEMVRQRRALEEIAARKRGRKDKHGVVILDSDDDEDAAGPSNPPRQLGKGCSRDSGRGGGDDDDDDGDYTRFYSLLGM
nr:uncharacterized protein LOC109781065 [Aegilops tauschii subsp. strangulata]